MRFATDLFLNFPLPGPPFVIALDEVELVHFERVQFQLKNFDMVSFRSFSIIGLLYSLSHVQCIDWNIISLSIVRANLKKRDFNKPEVSSFINRAMST